ncbi:hypothetical protein GW829_13095, partial [bacterium]|nr:hypothetical protein [bacterium]
AKPCQKSSQDSAFSPGNLAHRKSAPPKYGSVNNINPIYSGLEIRDFAKNFSEWTEISLVNRAEKCNKKHARWLTGFVSGQKGVLFN